MMRMPVPLAMPMTVAVTVLMSVAVPMSVAGGLRAGLVIAVRVFVVVFCGAHRLSSSDLSGTGGWVGVEDRVIVPVPGMTRPGRWRRR